MHDHKKQMDYPDVIDQILQKNLGYFAGLD